MNTEYPPAEEQFIPEPQLASPEMLAQMQQQGAHYLLQQEAQRLAGLLESINPDMPHDQLAAILREKPLDNRLMEAWSDVIMVAQNEAMARILEGKFMMFCHVGCENL